MPADTLPRAEGRTLAALVRVQRRFLRSVNLERDFYSADPLDGYLLTAGALSAFDRLAQGIRRPHARAFSLTGPYGSGKSAFALFAAKVLAPGAMAGGLRERLRREQPDVGPALFDGGAQGFWPVLITGTREPIAPALQRGLFAALDRLPGDAARQVRAQLTALGEPRSPNVTGSSSRFGEGPGERLPSPPPPSARQVAALYAQAAMLAQAADPDCKGLLVIVDEMGKFLEYAALHPEQGDTQVLQEMAEHAVRSAPDAANLVVTVLHQAFEDYGHRLNGVQRAEWQKVQGRFADIAFGDGPEETLRLVAQAVTQSAESQSDGGINGLMAQEGAAGRGIKHFAPASLPDDEFADILRGCFPLHPLTLRLLPFLFRRFGQSERSLFSFLSSDDPHGFQDFLQRATLSPDAPPPLLRVDQLYDYVVHTLGATLYAHPSARQWSEAEEALLRLEGRDPLQARLVKCIGLLHILGEQTRLFPSRALLQFAVSDAPPGSVDAALDALEDGTFITYRRFREAFRLYEGSDIDVSARLREARQQVGGDVDAIRLAGRVEPIAPVVARRHSYETGTLRFFDVRPCRPQDLAAEVERGPSQGDGLLLLCLVGDKFETHEAEAWLRENLAAHPAIVVGLSRETEALREAAASVACLLWVQEETPDLRNDRVAQREVEERLQEATGAFEAEWARLLRPQTAAHAESAWFHRGERRPLRDYRQLQELLSDACHAAYPETPRLLNELINRRQISSTAASARRILIAAMLEHGDAPGLGLTGFPPEKSIYVSLLGNTGIHRPIADPRSPSFGREGPPSPPIMGGAGQEGVTGNDSSPVPPIIGGLGGPSYHFGPPDPVREPQFARLWDDMTGFLFRDGWDAQPLAALNALLTSPPYGLADGLVPVLVCALLLCHRDQVAVYEEGRFVTELNAATFERMIKRPEDYRLQGYRIAGERADVLARFASGLLRDGSAPTLVNVVRQLYREFGRLPEYTLKTRKLAADAQALRNLVREGREPELLLFRDLPTLLGVRPFSEAPPDADGADNTGEFFRRWNAAMAAVLGAYPALLTRVESALLAQFGLPTWAEIRRRAEALRASVTEPALKTFVLRAGDGTLDRAGWLESVAAGVVGRPPRTWGDAEEDRFGSLLPPLGSAFRHAQLLAFEKGERGAGETHVAVRLCVTEDDGTETARVTVYPKSYSARVRESSAQLRVIVNTVLGNASQDTRVAAFGWALKEYMKANENTAA